MPKDIEQFRNPREYTRESIEPNETTGSADFIRSQIGRFLTDNEFRRTLDSESLANYEALVKKQGHEGANDLANLHKFYKFMEEQWKEVQAVKKRMEGHIDQAVRDKIISDKDRGFYDEKMEENITTGKQIVTRETMEKAEKELKESLENRKKEREQYDAIANNPIVKDGILKVDERTEIKIPDEKGYLEMSVPERRKFLKQMEDAMPKAGKYAEKNNEVESIKLKKEYSALLEKARKDGWIGKATIKKYMDAFEKISLQEKQYWLREMKNGKELARYKELWGNIRKTLSGKNLKQIEKLRDKMGYTGLLKEFGRLKEEEGNEIDGQYEKKLADLLKRKIISKHTYSAFLQDIKSKPLEEKQMYLESFPMQMRRYEALRVKIDQMKDKGAQKVLNAMYDSDEFGFTEIQNKYNRLSASGAQGETETDKELNAIENKTVRLAVQKSADILDISQKKSLIQRLSNYFDNKLSAKEDPVTYQKTLRKARKEHRKENIKEIKKHHAFDHEQSDEGLEEERDEEQMTQANTLSSLETKDEIAALNKPDEDDDHVVTKEEYKKKLPRRARTEVNADKTFVKKTFYTHSNQEKHVMRAQLNSVEGVRAVNSLQGLNKQTDDLSINIWANNRFNELKLNEVRATIRFLRKDVAEVTGAEEEKMAA